MWLGNWISKIIFLKWIIAELQVLVDSRVILEFLDDAFPDLTILPKEPYQKARDRHVAIKLKPVSS